MTPDEFGGFDLDDVVKKAEENKRQEAEKEKNNQVTAQPVLAESKEFSIAKLDDCYRITGVQIKNEYTCYDVDKKFPIGMSRWSSDWPKDLACRTYDGRSSAGKRLPKANCMSVACLSTTRFSALCS
jgi:hypothetical protein